MFYNVVNDKCILRDDIDTQLFTINNNTINEYKPIKPIKPIKFIDKPFIIRNGSKYFINNTNIWCKKYLFTSDINMDINKWICKGYGTHGNRNYTNDISIANTSGWVYLAG